MIPHADSWVIGDGPRRGNHPKSRRSDRRALLDHSYGSELESDLFRSGTSPLGSHSDRHSACPGLHSSNRGSSHATHSTSKLATDSFMSRMSGNRPTLGKFPNRSTFGPPGPFKLFNSDLSCKTGRITRHHGSGSPPRSGLDRTL